MATFTPGSNEVSLNGTTPVTLVAAPAASIQRMVRSISIQQRDTAAVTLTVRILKGATTRQLWAGTLQPGDTWIDDTVRVLDATDESITAVLSGAPATTNPDVQASYADLDQS